MKKYFTFIFSLLAAVVIHSQQYDWKNMTPEQRKSIINKMSPSERKELLKTFKCNIMVEELSIDDRDKDEFTKIYGSYLEEQDEIKKSFNSKFNPEKLSDQEARIKLQQSFDTGEKLIQNRRKYSDKMQKVIPPQKVLKLFQSEGSMRDKVNSKRTDARGSNSNTRSGAGNRR